MLKLPILTLLLSAFAFGQGLPPSVDLVRSLDGPLSAVGFSAVAVDSIGNTYIAAQFQAAIPSQLTARIGPLGSSDVAVLKVDPTGQLLYFVLIGGSDFEFPGSIKVDSSGNAYVTMTTRSNDFPATSPFQPPSVGSSVNAIVKLGATGNLIYATVLDWTYTPLALDVSPSGTVYIGGIAKSGFLPVSAGAYYSSPQPPGAANSGFVATLDSLGNAVGGTYFQGVSSLLLRQNGDVLLSTGSTIAVLNSSLTNLLVSQPLSVAQIALDGANNLYTSDSRTIRKYSPDGQQLLGSVSFNGVTFNQFAVTRSGSVLLYFQSAPPNTVTQGGTPPCQADILQPSLTTPRVPVTGKDITAAIPTFNTGLLASFAPDGTLNYAAFMADSPTGLTASPTGDSVYAVSARSFVSGLRLIRIHPTAPSVSGRVAVGCLVHGASGQIVPIAPGTIVTLNGENLGPSSAAPFAFQDGHLPFSLGGTSVTVDGVPAPLLAVQATQIQFLIPWAISTNKVQVPVCVTANGDTSCLYPYVTQIAPEFFMVGSLLAAQNADYTLNSPQNPAHAGSYMLFYLTGLGALNGPMVDGALAGFDLEQVAANVYAEIAVSFRGPIGPGGTTGAIALPILYAGTAPTLVNGAAVIVVQIPRSVLEAFSYGPIRFVMQAPGDTTSTLNTGTIYIAP